MTHDTWRARFMRGECGVESIIVAAKEWRGPELDGQRWTWLGLSREEYTCFCECPITFASPLLHEREAARGG